MCRLDKVGKQQCQCLPGGRWKLGWGVGGMGTVSLASVWLPWMLRLLSSVLGAAHSGWSSGTWQAGAVRSIYSGLQGRLRAWFVTSIWDQLAGFKYTVGVGTKYQKVWEWCVSGNKSKCSEEELTFILKENISCKAAHSDVVLNSCSFNWCLTWAF